MYVSEEQLIQPRLFSYAAWGIVLSVYKDQGQHLQYCIKMSMQTKILFLGKQRWSRTSFSPSASFYNAGSKETAAVVG